MARFLRRFLWSALLVAALALALDALLMHGLRRRTTDVFGVWNDVVHGRAGADVLFTGSSRSLVHFDAAAIAARTGLRCYNIGMDGTQLDLQLGRLRTYLAHHPAPRLVVQEVDIISLEPDSGLYFAQQYAPYLGEPAVYEAVRKVAPDHWKDRWLPLYPFMRHGPGLTALAVQGLLGLEDTLHDPVHLGFELRDWKWEGSFDNFLKDHPDGVRYHESPHAEATLRTLIRTARAAGSLVVLCYTPELVENQRITLNRASILGTFARVAREEGVPFWDFSQAPFCADRGFFYNSQHLNARGVARLTPMVADSVKTLLERAAQPPSARP
ncbi:MAG: hypothetical protein IT228_03800 [Flavobacteriales bacterium]|nr:hypothetical protein [Flavobacteriales bacterium]MCC6576445.1 hypothetical protein [Flavobacteriales bacterium]NUQ16061.1 hypothetical protein [Flavobacteriales bacterium]